ncbi:MAG: dTDP-4-dehydrorhamnose 3,5-epimerase [Halioglobus sp.]
MKFVETPLLGVYVVEPRVFGDERGFFQETWNAQTFAEAGFDLNFVQDNHSRSPRGTLRGLHYQTEHTQGKLVRVTSGKVYDAVVDLRQSSPTFGKSFGITLSAQNKKMLWVPPGFAHGFYVTSETADFLYKCTGIYHPQSEVTLAWNDPTANIDWPIPTHETPLLSGKDGEGNSFETTPLFD